MKRKRDAGRERRNEGGKEYVSIGTSTIHGFCYTTHLPVRRGGTPLAWNHQTAAHPETSNCELYIVF